MRRIYKLVVSGVFNAGKTTFVNTLSDIPTINTDIHTSTPYETGTKASTTVALDYGQITLPNDIRVNLFGTPGQTRFDFMREILAVGADGLIFLVDAADTNKLSEATQVLTQFMQSAQIPYVIVANKADIATLSTEEIRAQLNLSASTLIVPCVATDRESIQSVVEQMVALINVGL
ncbi:MAG: ATP/GTP-binding protein [Chloroflexota bacterium]